MSLGTWRNVFRSLWAWVDGRLARQSGKDPGRNQPFEIRVPYLS